MRDDVSRHRAAQAAELQATLLLRGEKKTLADYCRERSLFEKGQPHPMVKALIADRAKVAAFVKACEDDADLRRALAEQGIELEEVRDYADRH